MAEPTMLIPLPDDMARLMKLAQRQAGEIELLRERVQEAERKAERPTGAARKVNMSTELASPCGSDSRAVLGVVAQPLPYWVPVASALPDMGVPVWLYEPGRGMWVGAREDTGDGWLWGNTYGSHYYAETSRGVGRWAYHDNEQDDDYAPTTWMPLPEAPTPNAKL